MAPVRLDAEADVLAALGIEKGEAAQEDPLRRRTLWWESVSRSLARHPLMLLYETLEVPTGTHLAESGSLRRCAPPSYIAGSDNETSY